MIGFHYSNGQLHAESVPLARIARDVGTPAYVYSAGLIRQAYRQFAAAFADRDATICYAVKANSNLAVIRTLALEGAGADVVSGGELARALAAGVPPHKIVFAGVGKTVDEMRQGLQAGILQFNVESEAELLRLNEVVLSMGRVAEIAIRVNPDVDAKTHAKISTGTKANKFGIDIDRAAAIYDLAAGLKGIRASAVAVHIGSQLTQIDPYEQAFTRLVDLVRALKAKGHPIERIDCGGGIGIAYKGERTIAIDAYAAMVKRVTDGSGCALVFEPGRHLVGNAGVLLSQVLYRKPMSSGTALILDAAMNDLVRPAMYDAWHEVIPLREPVGDAREVVDLVGPVCESSDTFARDRSMPPLAEGDLVAILSAGAYGAVMSSSYNTRPLVPEILVDGDRFAVIRPRVDVAALLAAETLPDFLPGLAAE